MTGRGPKRAVAVPTRVRLAALTRNDTVTAPETTPTQLSSAWADSAEGTAFVPAIGNSTIGGTGFRIDQAETFML